jgi:hypothetical protein
MTVPYAFVSLDRWVNRRRRHDMAPALRQLKAELGADAHLILGLVFERDHGWFQRQHDDMLVQLQTHLLELGFSNLHFVFNSQNRQSMSSRELEIFKRARSITYIDYFLVKTLRMMPTQQFNNQWNQTASQILFLTGKPHKANRALLLSKFYEAGKLDQLVWSLHTDQYMNAILQRQYFAHYTTQQFQDFLDSAVKNPDQANIWYQYQNCHFHGFPFDHELYSQTSLSLVSETDYWPTNTHWITEKTWRTMANHHPFVFAGTDDSIRYLESLGFNLFRDYIHPDLLNGEQDLHRRLEQLCLSCIQFRNFCLQNPQIVHNAVQHNYQRFMQLAELDRDNLVQMLERVGLDGSLVPVMLDRFSFREYDLARGIIP